VNKPKPSFQKSSGASKFPSDFLVSLWKREAARELLAMLGLVGLASILVLLSKSATRRGEATLAIFFSISAVCVSVIIALALAPRLLRRLHTNRQWTPLSFSITREGGVYILGIFVLSAVAINTGNNLMFLILSALLAAIITSGIAARLSLRAVSISMQVPENVFEGERVYIKVTLRNQKFFLPAFSIAVQDWNHQQFPSLFDSMKRLTFRRTRQGAEAAPPDSSVLRQPAYFPLVPAREARSELVAQAFPKRGPYRLDGFQISTRFPFGFFRRGERIRAQGELLVYPSIRAIPAHFHLLPFLPGQMEGLRAGPGDSLYAIRKYQGGESVRLIDWKATAKTGELMARQFARDEETKFCLILDLLIAQTAAPDYLDQFEKAVSLAASLAAHFVEEGSELEFLTPDEYVPRDRGTIQLYRILRCLAVASCRLCDRNKPLDLYSELSQAVEREHLQQILSDKIFKIIITSRPRGSFPSEVWRSSHVVYFDEL
jgi:uncharacterized protein (DUF58 family)